MAERPVLKDFYRIVHDIKTPVNTVTGRLQMALHKVRDEKVSRNIIQGISGAYNMLRKFYNLYDLVALEEDPEYPDRGPANVGEAWEAGLKKWAPLAETMSIKVAGSVPPDLTAAARKDILLRFFDNMLSNSILHPEGCTMITLRAEQSGGLAKVLLRNDGYSGPDGDVEIPEVDFSEGFTINRLGLAAMKALAERLGGEFSARGSAGAFIAALSLPIGE